MAAEQKSFYRRVRPCAIVAFGLVLLILILANVSKHIRATDGPDSARSWRNSPLPKPAPAILKKLRPKCSACSKEHGPHSPIKLHMQLGKSLFLHPSVVLLSSRPPTVQQLSTICGSVSTLHVPASVLPSISNKALDLMTISPVKSSKLYTIASSTVTSGPTVSSRYMYEDSLLSPGQRSTVRRNCSPRQRVMFLKTHKTGGSTMTNIFNRFADEHNLTMALPTPGYNRFSYPSLFSTRFVDRSRIPKAYPDILCNHARYKQSALEKVMSRDAVFVTILRNPVTNFESVFYYMEIAHSCGITGGDNLQMISKFLESNCFQRLSGSSNLIKNGMLFDLGLSASQHSDLSIVKSHISKIAKRFQLVLLMEYFDESLVLLKRQLCWRLEDVAYFPFLKSATTRKQLPESLKSKIRKWSRGDVMLYQYFNRTFWKKVANEGTSFFDEVQQLKKLNQELRRRCVGGEYTHLGHGQTYSKITSFTLNKNVKGSMKARCCRMLRHEVHYIDYHRRRQKPGRTGRMPDC